MLPLTETDIAAGLWDGAEVSAYEVDWSDDTSRLTGRYTLGAIERSGAAFRAELRSRAAGLDRAQGRAYLNACNARLGDPRCGVDISVPGRRAVGRVVRRGRFPGWQPGLTRWRSVRRQGWVINTILNLWYRPAAALQPGDRIEVTAGCDKTFVTCRARFGNGDNFRGCPHMPGNDVLWEFGRKGDVTQDGGSRFGWRAVVNAGISGSDIRDIMLEAVERRFGDHRAPSIIEMLFDNGSPYIAKDAQIFARQLGLKPYFTPVQSPQSNASRRPS